ncbi:MAG: helix-turn-helix transcriptional regulator [Roseburia sp.]|nr:helix-turn-helix transcriptional regulator [Roseburia sp.]
MNILEYENYQEKVTHSDPDFPYITYPCSIPLDFPHVPLHWHDEMEFIYIKKGSGIVTVDFTQYVVDAGTIVLIIPGQLHSIEQLADCSMEYENIIFHPNILISKTADACNTDFLLPLLNGKIAVPTLFKPSDAFYTEVAACIDANDEIRKTFPKGYQLFLKGQLFMLFYILIEKCSDTVVEQKDSKSLEKLKRILKYIENHYMHKITIADAAAEVSLSQSHFMKYFKNTMGTSFIDYLGEYRLTMASRLLLSSDSSILAISEEVGYDNLSYFNRTFKKRYGMTPSAYRKKGRS